VEAVWGVEGLSRIVVFDAVNQWSLLVVAPLLFASSIAGASFSPRAALANVRKQLLSPCLLAMFLAVALRLAGWSLPTPVAALTSSLAVANKPLALIALGILFDPQLKDGQLRDIATLLALRYGASFLLGAFILATFSASMGASTTAVVFAALISPVPLLTVTYAMEYGCDIGLGASAVNAGNACSFALLLAVANADFANPAALAPAVAAAGVLLTLFGVLGAKKQGGSSRVGGGDANTLTQARASAMSSDVQTRRQRRSSVRCQSSSFSGVCGVIGGREGVNVRASVSVHGGANTSFASSRARTTGNRMQQKSSRGLGVALPSSVSARLVLV
jgi:hypothetical protein